MKRILILTLFMVLFISHNAMAADYGDIVYNKVNIHVDKGGDTKGSYAVYTGAQNHAVIPVNSKLKIGKWMWRNGFTLVVMDTGEKVYYEYNKSRMKMDFTEYLDKITAPAPVALKLPKLDMESVKKGVAVPGMTKDGVFAALGYPPTHKTPSMDDAKWTYWINRFKTRTVEFDNNGIVTKVTPPFE